MRIIVTTDLVFDVRIFLDYENKLVHVLDNQTGNDKLRPNFTHLQNFIKETFDVPFNWSDCNWVVYEASNPNSFIYNDGDGDPFKLAPEDFGLNYPTFLEKQKKQAAAWYEMLAMQQL
ncbi:hypothetical protein [Paenibacillus glycanilyticus]|uniref:Phage protein n=1 Tax=Paenibacillus glycanilyticus TaxID=126569 RepID=A0ABQ6GP74_9BACL|nr:hypothetical protein [Paenibacillus glycanilyticus]GLX70822.1 hypothetical protein MU1_51690 [Paenibacillus glycanilyticus]